MEVSLRFNLHVADADERQRVQAEVVTKVKCNSEGARELILNGVSFKDVTVKDQVRTSTFMSVFNT